MASQIPGIHHVTAIASDPQRNVDFYTALLGLRLVKLTVNFDDPGTYHFYYGDETGSPGTILTFFPWPGAPRGRQGTGQVTGTSFSIPTGALDYWQARFEQNSVPVEPPIARFDERVLPFYDPDGLRLELVAHAGETRPGWQNGPVPPEWAVRGFYGVTLAEEGYERTAALLTETMGFRLLGQDGSRFRYTAGDGAVGAIADLLCQPDGRPGTLGAGTVHHVAWRALTDAVQTTWRQTLSQLDYNVTPVMDRQYFHSIYFREPGGVLFEIATDPPGFATDETPATLGTHLKLPPWLESRRAYIEQLVPPLRLPGTA
jgi:glyoxalase family protein